MPNLLIALVYLVFFFKLVQSDLPSCIRAKCSHCKVPFIAQMCPMACAGCPFLLQNFLTSEKFSQNLHELSNGVVQVKVPHAQRIPIVAETINLRNTSMKIHTQKANEFIQKNLPIHHHEQQQQLKLIQVNVPPRNFAQQGQFGIQQPQEQPFAQYTQNFGQQFRQTTNFGGFYGQQVYGQQSPVFSATHYNNNPFQPFMQNSVQTQQTMAQVPNQTPQSTFGIYQAEQNYHIPSQTNQIPQLQQTYYGKQQQLINASPSERDQHQQNSFQMPTHQPIVHAVPNVINNPLQRINQLNNFESQAFQNRNEKWINGKTQYGKEILDAGIKMPGSGTSMISEENGGKCPKPNWEPCVPKDVANQRFQNCCSKLGDGCSQLCSYDQNLTTIQLAVLTGRCPVNKVSDLMICASGYEDATSCCHAFGVFEPGFEHCKPYCNPAGGLPNDGMLAEKYRCLQKLQQIQKCFYLIQQP